LGGDDIGPLPSSRSTGPPGQANDLSGQVVGSVLQAGSVRDVHFHSTAVPAVPAVNPPRQLPPVTALFTGRKEDLTWLNQQWLHATGIGIGALLVVSGTAGVGKSSLALAWLRGRMSEFPDGQLYVDLGGYSPGGPMAPAEVVAGFLRALGVPPERIPAQPAERSSLLRTTTHGQRISILLDNAVSAAQVRTLALTSPGCATLVTTRGTLSGLTMDGARFHRLEPWRAQTGVALMQRMLGEERIAAEPEAALLVAQLCGGLPLALGVAAAKLTSRPRWRIARLAEALAQDGHRLEALTDDEDSAVIPALDGSYQVLSPNGAHLYRALGACPVAWFDLGMIAAVLGTSAEQAETRVDVLVDANLLEDLGGRYRFHDLVRLHAMRCAQTDTPVAEHGVAFGRLVDFLLASATRAEEELTPSHRILNRTYRFTHEPPAPFTGPDQALDWLEEQRPNLMSVLRHCVAEQIHDAVWQLADAMWPLFLRRRYPEDRLEAQNLGVNAARLDGDERAEGSLLTSLAGTLKRAGQLQDAAAVVEQALELYQRIGDQRGLAQACNGLAKIYLELGELERAGQFFGRALELRVQIGYRRGVYLTYQGIGLVAAARGDLARAAWHLRRSYRGLTAVGDTYDAAWSLALWAQATAERGPHARVLRRLDRARAAMAAAGSAFGQGEVLEIIGQVHEAGGEPAAAREHYAAALEYLAATGPVAELRVRARLNRLQPC